MAASITKRSSSKSNMANFLGQQTYDLSDFIAAEPEPTSEDEDSEDPEWSEDFKYTYDGERIMPKRKAHPEFDTPAFEPLKPSTPTEEKIPAYVDGWKPDSPTTNPYWPAPDLRKSRNWISSDEQIRREAWIRYCLAIPQAELEANLNYPHFHRIVSVRMWHDMEKAREAELAARKEERN